MDISGVYLIENTLNGHRYIGSSINLLFRISKHFRELRRGRHHSKHLQRAYKKYGEDMFSYRPLLICEPFELLRYEQAMLDIYHPEYNMTPTAGSTLGMKFTEETRQRMRIAQTGRTQSPEARRKVSEAQRGKKESEETRRKNGLARKGKIPWMKGKHHTEEANQKNREAHLGKQQSEEANKKRSLALKGKPKKPISDETRRKMSEAQKRRFARDTVKEQ